MAAYGALMLNAALSASLKRVLKSSSEALAVPCDEQRHENAFGGRADCKSATKG